MLEISMGIRHYCQRPQKVKVYLITRILTHTKIYFVLLLALLTTFFHRFVLYVYNKYFNVIGDRSLSKLLIDYGADLNAVNYNTKDTALIQAVSRSDTWGMLTQLNEFTAIF